MRDWTKKQDKRDALLDVLKHIVKNPAAGEACVGRGKPPFKQDVDAHKLFEDSQIGNIKIPDDSRVVIFRRGEAGLEGAGSIIIELPPDIPPNIIGRSDRSEWSDRLLLSYVLGNYRYW
jgi:hypothetical protein